MARIHRYDDYIPERTMSADKVKITDKLNMGNIRIGYMSRCGTGNFYFENVTGDKMVVLKYEDWNIEYLSEK